MNKKGWLKIVEAFTAIILILAVTLIIIERNYTESEDISQRVYEAEIKILEGVVREYKTEILKNDFSGIEEYASTRVPNYLNCEIRICELGNECNLIDLGEKSKGKNIYVQSALIIDNSGNNELRLYCWIK